MQINKKGFDYFLGIMMIFLASLLIFCADEPSEEDPPDPPINTVNSPPTVNITNEPYEGDEEQEITFSATVDDELMHDLDFEWNFGDGTITTPTYSNYVSITAAHTYDDPGAYTVTLTVDDLVNAPRSDSTTVTINEAVNDPPTADAGGPYSSGTVDVEFSFDGSGSSDPENDTLTYDWDFGDGDTSTEQNPDHTYIVADTYTVTLTVNDGEYDSDPDTVTVTIEAEPVNDAPVADVGGHETGAYWALPGVPVTFHGSGTDDLLNPDELVYYWDFDNDGTIDESGVNLTDPVYTYASEGTYTVSLTVNDGNSDSSPDTASIVFVEQSLPDTGLEDCYIFGAANCDDINYDDPAPPSYYSYGQDAQYGDNILDLTPADPIVTDNKTGLVWEMNGNGDAVEDYSAATQHCSDLGEGWRLPTRRELLSIVSYGHTNPTIYNTVFTNIGYGDYWTDTPLASDPTDDLVWPVNFYDGTISEFFGLSKDTDSAYIRCVQDPPAVGAIPRFEIMNDQSITDWDSGLNWEAVASDTTMNWFEALYYCESETSGLWRLPNIKELESILSLDRENPAVDTQYFPDDDTALDPRKDYWSSTSAISMGGIGAFQVNVKNGEVNYTSGKDAYQGYVRCVRKLPDEMVP